MSKNNTNVSSGIGFTGLLTMIFIFLKLTEQIAWSWWWILSPIWINCAIVILFLLVVCLVTILSK
jgi:hypothetical protein